MGWGIGWRLGTVLVVHGELALQLFADVLHLVFLVEVVVWLVQVGYALQQLCQWMAGITRMLAL